MAESPFTQVTSTSLHACQFTFAIYRATWLPCIPSPASANVLLIIEGVLTHATAVSRRLCSLQRQAVSLKQRRSWSTASMVAARTLSLSDHQALVPYLLPDDLAHNQVS